MRINKEKLRRKVIRVIACSVLSLVGFGIGTNGNKASAVFTPRIDTATATPIPITSPSNPFHSFYLNELKEKEEQAKIRAKAEANRKKKEKAANSKTTTSKKKTTTKSKKKTATKSKKKTTTKQSSKTTTVTTKTPSVKVATSNTSKKKKATVKKYKASFKINPTSVKLSPGKKTTLKIAQTGDKCMKSVRWSTSKKKIATVSTKGVVVAKKKGSATIKAKIKYYKDSKKKRTSSKTVKCKVSVKNGALKDSSSAPTASKITYGQKLSASLLVGGKIIKDGKTYTEKFEWANPTEEPEAGTHSYKALRKINGKEYSFNVPVTVNKANSIPDFESSEIRLKSECNTEGEIYNGYTTNDIDLSNLGFKSAITKESVPGELTFAISTFVTGDNTLQYTFTPSDGKNFNTITDTLQVSAKACINMMSCYFELDDITYTGEFIFPTVSIYTNESKQVKLSEDKDYEILTGVGTFGNNKNVSDDSFITIVGKGIYNGQHEYHFKILPFNINDASISLYNENEDSDFVYNGLEQTFDFETIKKGDTELEKNVDFTVTYENNRNAGTALVKFEGIGNFTGNVTKTFTIQKRDIETCKIDVTKSVELNQNGKAIPNISVSYWRNDTDKMDLIKDKDYQVSFSSNDEPGTGYATITGIGNFVGSADKEFSIIGTTSSKSGSQAKNTKTFSSKTTKVNAKASAKKITLKWKKIKKTKKYTIYYKKANAKKWKKVGTTKKCKYTIKKLKKNTKYKFKIKGYKKSIYKTAKTKKN